MAEVRHCELCRREELRYKSIRIEDAGGYMMQCPGMELPNAKGSEAREIVEALRDNKQWGYCEGEDPQTLVEKADMKIRDELANWIEKRWLAGDGPKGA